MVNHPEVAALKHKMSQVMVLHQTAVQCHVIGLFFVSTLMSALVSSEVFRVRVSN